MPESTTSSVSTASKMVWSERYKPYVISILSQRKSLCAAMRSAVLASLCLYICASQSEPRFALASPDCQFSLHQKKLVFIVCFRPRRTDRENDQSLSSSRSISAILKTASSAFGTPTSYMLGRAELEAAYSLYDRYYLYECLPKSASQSFTLVWTCILRFRNQVLVQLSSVTGMTSCSDGRYLR